MSKIEELHETYCLAVKSYMNSNGGALIWDAERAGIAAVVRALRDEIRKPHYSSWEDIDDFLDQILGSDAGEKVGEYTGGMNDLSVTPATDPAPAVCEWTGEEYVTYSTSCESEHEVDPHKAPPKHCPSCGLPIKFTEAK